MWTVDICTLKGQLIGLIEDHIDRRSVQAAVTDCRTGNVGRAACEHDRMKSIYDRFTFTSLTEVLSELKKSCF